MKRSISLLSVLAFVLAFSGSVFGQTPINASAEVVSTLTNTEQQSVDFDLIEQDWSTDPSIDPKDGSTSTTGSSGFQNNSNATAGLVTVEGTAGATVQVQIASSITLNNGTDDITFTPTYNWSYDNVTSGSPTNPELGTNATSGFQMTLDGSTDGDGQNTIFIGGSLSKQAGNLSGGSYTGSSDIIINYL